MSKAGGFRTAGSCVCGPQIGKGSQGLFPDLEVTLVVFSVGHGSREWLWIHIQQFHMTRPLSRSC